MNEEKRKLFKEIADTIRFLAVDGVHAAQSGHPGLPMGCAEFGAYLWGDFMRYNSQNPDWFNRDRFVLSAGHGSMFLYAGLHLSGYKVSIEDLKNFRQLGSNTPGHPERLDTDGVEVTTGPLGQGVANAVGYALSYKMLAQRFNREGSEIVDNKIICLAGDGCLMEGVSSEASSLAGHLCLNNLILVYDCNKITLDGKWDESCSDDQVQRYKAYGWNVVEVNDGNDIDQIKEVMDPLRRKLEKPTLVVLKTVIGKGSPNREGKNKAHGADLGEEEIKLTKEALNWTREAFSVPAAVKEYFVDKVKEGEKAESDWNEHFEKWETAHSDLADLFSKMKDHHIPEGLNKEIMNIKMPEDNMAGRKVSEMCIQVAAKHMPYLIGGAADLSGSNNTNIATSQFVTQGDFSPQNIKYGVREFAMSAMANAMSATFLRPFVATFLCFYDYARPAVRLAALSHHPVIFVYTHDSIGLGEDGPTHQPVEHLAAMRAIPNLHVWRSGDANEAKASWIAALNRTTGPTVLIYTRQGLPTQEASGGNPDEKALKGAYIIIEEDTSKPIDYTLIGTGSELSLAIDVAERLRSTHGQNVRVVSMPCWELFEEQDKDYKNSVLGGEIGQRVCMETGASFGWERYIGLDGIAITMDEFGKSAPIADLMQHFGFTVDQVIERLKTKGKSD